MAASELSQTARRRVPRPEREQQMLEAADRVFARRGYQAASMDEIAAEVGVTKPMLYAYFGSKEGLYLATVQRAGEMLAQRLRDAAEGGPAERLEAGVHAFFAFVDERRSGWAVLYREASAGGGPVAARVASLRTAVAATVSQLLGEMARRDGAAADALEAEPLAHALVGAGESLANWWLDHPDEPLDLMAARLMSFAWLGLERLASGERWAPARATSHRTS
jgi:AcrR family transcriptional regulator